MVKSKKLSKSSLAVIILSLLLILSMIVGMTAAWFVDSKSGADSGTGTDVVFGTLGATTITVTNASWTNINDVAVEDRGYYMPGDTVVGASVEISYDQDGAEDKVYYLVKGVDSASQEAYYTIADGKFVAATTAAGSLDATANKVVIKAEAGAVTVKDNTSANPVEVKKENAAQIDNLYQGQGIEFANALGFDVNGSSYEFRIIQSSNLTAEQAYYALTAGWNADGNNSISA